MEFKLSEKVVYPNHGVGVIEQISYGYLNGRSERYYMLKIVSSGLKVMVPQSNILNVGLRPIIRNTQAGAVLSFLKKAAPILTMIGNTASRKIRIGCGPDRSWKLPLF